IRRCSSHTPPRGRPGAPSHGASGPPASERAQGGRERGEERSVLCAPGSGAPHDEGPHASSLPAQLICSWPRGVYLLPRRELDPASTVGKWESNQPSQAARRGGPPQPAKGRLFFFLTTPGRRSVSPWACPWCS